MLKLGNDKSYSLRFADKERLFTKQFAKAFMIALGIHFAAIFLFKINHPITKESKLIFSPVNVESEVKEISQASSFTQNDLGLYQHIPSLPERKPELVMIQNIQEISPQYLFEEFYAEKKQ